METERPAGLDEACSAENAKIDAHAAQIQALELARMAQLDKAATEQQGYGLLGGAAQLAPQIDPQWEAKRRADEALAIRLECLRIATGCGEEDPLASARAYYAFVTGE